MHDVPDCPFCRLDDCRVFHRTNGAAALWDAYPVSEHHALVVPLRHVESWFDLTPVEHLELVDVLAVARREIERRAAIDGFNIGVNVGAAAGQSIFHVHVHLIPRHRGDVPRPRGGVRHVIPGRGDYPEYGQDGTASVAGGPSASPLTTGRERPLLPGILYELDRADDVDLAVAFVLNSGVDLLYQHFRERLDRGGRIRFLTGDYLDLTDPSAMRRLLDLEGRISLRVFETRGTSFHPKAYIFRTAGQDGAAFVGSSNLTDSALQGGVEWNYRVDRSQDAGGFEAISKAFDALFADSQTRPITYDWIDQYERRRRPAGEPRVADITSEALEPPPEPHAVQAGALICLERTRQEGNTAGLVVLATGLGKTWLAAFDSAREEYRRILFVAHREEILGQAKQTFRRIRPEARLGTYSGGSKDAEAEILFASVQTLGRAPHLNRFARDAFDYIVIDEFHHAAAATYRKLSGHFQPKFLLGITATPDRTDGADLLALCQENLVYQCDFIDGINADLLSAFHYFGVPDDVDYTNIPWRSNRFDEEALTTAVATQRRAANAMEQYRKHGGSRALGFCCSMRHADFMATCFREAGVRAVAVHSGPASAPRTASLERLGRGELDIVFTVDMFNEGVDLPNVDTVLMLRPTESSILWTQQFGRGLRKAEGKDHLRVIDYIGNHRVFLLKLRTLLAPLLPGGLRSNEQLSHALQQVAARSLTLPQGCEITYELRAVEIVQALIDARPGRGTGVEHVLDFYLDFRGRHGVRPTASEAYHAGCNPRAVRDRYGSWFGFVASMSDLPLELSTIVHDEQEMGPAGGPGAFLELLEITPMTRSYKMIVLLAMLENDQFPGKMAMPELVREVRRIARRRDALQREFGETLEDDHQLEELLARNPVDAWTSGKGTGGARYFDYESREFASRFRGMDGQVRRAFADAVREIVEWRLAEYLNRQGVSDDEQDKASGGVPAGEQSVCKVSHSGGQPMLFLPDRERTPGLPLGWTRVLIDGVIHEANFVKIAVNVVRQPGMPDNLLPGILQGWFGPKAGRPGTAHRVRFVPENGALAMKPLNSVQDGLELWREYPRQRIPELFGLPHVAPAWQQGFIVQQRDVFLLVTLDKGALGANHQYQDRFRSPGEFQWQSQNRTRQASKHGEIISKHEELGYAVHLWVREAAKRGQQAAPFVYCGEVDFRSWQGEKPITVQWRLRTPVPERMRKRLRVSG